MRRDEIGLSASPQRRAFKDELLKRMREHGINASELARRTELSKDAISSYTTMRSLPTKETLSKLAKALKCKPKELLSPVAGTDDIKVLEFHEYSRPGFKLLVARVVVSEDDVADLFNQLRDKHANSLAEIAQGSRPRK
jgi:transcriptional regulator with XRE-family HTH domain